MKRALSYSIVLAAVVTTSIVACTRGTKDRSLKGIPATKADLKDPIADASAGGKIPPGSTTPGGTPSTTPGAVTGTAPTTKTPEVNIVDENNNTVGSKEGFTKIEAASAEAQKAAKSLVRILVPNPESTKVPALDFAKLYKLEGNSVKEVMAAIQKFDEKNNPEGFPKLDKDLQKKVLVQFESCGNADLKDCLIYTELSVQIGFMVSGNKIYTTADFMKVYYEIGLKNNVDYSKLATPAEKIAFLKNTPLNLLLKSDPDLTKSDYFSYYGKMITQLDSISENALKLIESADYAPEKLLPRDAVVVLKLSEKPANAIPALARAQMSCADLAAKETKVSIVGQSLAEEQRETNAEKKTGSAAVGATVTTTGRTVVFNETILNGLSKQFDFLRDLDASQMKEVVPHLMLTETDSAYGFNGSPIINEKGEYLGIQTFHSENSKARASFGACLD